MYYVIKNQLVFLYSDLRNSIREEALKGKDPLFTFSSKIAGRKENEEAEALIYNTLLEKFEQNQKQFYEDWVRFDISGDTASANVWDLLYDYCHYYGYAYLFDLRDEQSKFKDDLMGNFFSQPMGEMFALCHNVTPESYLL